MVAPGDLTHEKFFAKSKSEQADLVLLPHFKEHLCGEVRGCGRAVHAVVS